MSRPIRPTARLGRLSVSRKLVLVIMTVCGAGTLAAGVALAAFNIWSYHQRVIQDFRTELSGGVVGIVIDARGRPLALPAERGERVRKLTEWNEALGVYPEEQKVTEG